MMAISGETRSYPLISVYMSRALGWDVGADWAGFGGDDGGFGGYLRGFGGEASGMVRDCQNQAPYQSTG